MDVVAVTAEGTSPLSDLIEAAETSPVESGFEVRVRTDQQVITSVGHRWGDLTHVSEVLAECEIPVANSLKERMLDELAALIEDKNISEHEREPRCSTCETSTPALMRSAGR